VKSKIFLLLVLVGCTRAIAQTPSLKRVKDKTAIDTLAGYTIRVSKDKPNEGTFVFKKPLVKENNAAEWLSAELKFRKGQDQYRVKQNAGKIIKDVSLQKLQQFYKGVKVEYGIANISSKADNIQFIQSEFYSIPDDFSVEAKFNESNALSSALSFVNAAVYEWQLPGAVTVKPAGELVILGNQKNTESPFLCYRFIINAAQPARSLKVFVDANNGAVVRSENMICNVNAAGSASTRYSGTQPITTDQTNGHYELKMTTPYGISIVTLNYGNRQFLNGVNNGLAKPFTDRDNSWIEYANKNLDDAALDVHFNMNIVSDFWFDNFKRKGFDNMGTGILNYVHVQLDEGPLSNAFFNMQTKSMYFGDGPAGADPKLRTPYTSLDVAAHEFAHGFCSATAELVYAWESGAINESLSDIWGICAERYANDKLDPSHQKDYSRVMEEILGPQRARNMADPANQADPAARKQPDTYRTSPYWIVANYDGCSPNENNDNCGVHRNSGVVNKWFYLLVSGGNGSNVNGDAYAVGGIGFNAAQEIVYLTEQNLTPNSSIESMAAVSRNAAVILYEPGSLEEIAVTEAWKAVGVKTDSIIFNMENQPVFLTNDFTSIAIGKKGHVWAGTSLKGLYKYDGSTWEKIAALDNRDINQITKDKNGGIWIAQAGHEGAKATAGGVNYFSTESAASNQFFGSSINNNNLPSRFTRSIFVDTVFTGATPRVWTATAPDFNALLENEEVVFKFKGGGVGVGLNSSSPNFTRITKGLTPIETDLYAAKVISGNDKEIWAYDDVANKRHIMVYDAITKDSIHDYKVNGIEIPWSGIVTAIHIDKLKNVWLGFENGGLAVRDMDNKWYHVQLENGYPNYTKAWPTPTMQL
jgi:Zn-dependent metalloprotease